MKIIRIYGPGCAKCETTFRLVKQVVAEWKLKALVEKVTDPMQFAVAGVIVTPAIAIDGKVVFSGKVPGREELKSILLADSVKDSGSEIPDGEPLPCICQNAVSGKPCCRNKGDTLKKAAFWVALLFIIIVTVKIVNRTIHSDSTDKPAPSISPKP